MAKPIELRRVALTAGLLGLYALAPAVAQAQPSAVSPEQERLGRANAPKFHHNFSMGKFSDNGPLVAKNITVDSNNVKFSGRDNFVSRIERFKVPFPGLQLKDRIIIVDGDTAADNYVMQGVNEGPFAGHPPTGNKIEAMGSELFQFNAKGQMSNLITITELDRIAAQVKGDDKVGRFQEIHTLPNGHASAAERSRNRAAAGEIDKAINAGDEPRLRTLFAPKVTVNADGVVSSGVAAFLQTIDSAKRAVPNLTIRDEYVVADGLRAAVEYIMEGTPAARDAGAPPQPPASVHVRGFRFLHMNHQGLIDEVIVVHNQAEFSTAAGR